MGTAVIPDTLRMLPDEILSSSLDYLAADHNRIVISVMTNNKKAPGGALVVYGAQSIRPPQEVIEELYTESEKQNISLLLTKAQVILGTVDRFCDGNIDQDVMQAAISRLASIVEKDTAMLTYNWLHIQDITPNNDDILAYGYLFYPKQNLN